MQLMVVALVLIGKNLSYNKNTNTIVDSDIQEPFAFFSSSHFTIQFKFPWLQKKAYSRTDQILKKLAGFSNTRLKAPYLTLLKCSFTPMIVPHWAGSCLKNIELLLQDTFDCNSQTFLLNRHIMCYYAFGCRLGRSIL